MMMTTEPSDDLTVLRCHHCSAGRDWCAHCQNTRTIFWVSGRSFPYSPEGEKQARRASNDGVKTSHLA
jgi:hypothetical protein